MKRFKVGILHPTEKNLMILILFCFFFTRLEEEMYQLVISNYEERHRELMLENEDLRDCLLSLQRQLSGLLKRTGGMSTTQSKEVNICYKLKAVACSRSHYDCLSTFFQLPTIFHR